MRGNSEFRIQNSEWLRVLVVCLHSAFCILHSDVALAQNPQIAAVIVEQEGQPVTDPVITALVETTPGEPLVMREVRETIAQLMSLNRFEDVQVSEQPGPNGVTLRYALLPLHPVDRVEFRGALGLPEGDLRRVVTERFGAAPSAGRAAEVAETLRAAYRRRGYPDARVTPRIEETHNPDRATLALEVDAGRRVRIGLVRFNQIDESDSGALLGIPNVAVGQPYDQDVIEQELAAWVDRYKSRGYYEARASHGVSFPPGDDGAFVTVNIARGPRVVIAFAGDPIPENERDRLVPVRDEGSADEDLLEDAALNISDYLRARGYRDARVEYASAEQDGELTITFTVTRGPRHVVETVAVTGNSALPDAELQPLLRLEEGAVFTQAALGSAVAAIENTYRARGYSRVQVKSNVAVLPPASPADADRDVEVTIAVAEGPRTIVRGVAFTGATVFTEAQLRAMLTTAPGRAYSVVDVARDRDRLDLEYRNRGFENVVVNPDVALAENDTQADVRFTISEGPQIIVDHVIILGNERIDTETIRRELLIRPGEPLGYTALIESRSRLVALGLFRRIQIEPLAQGSEPRRDVLVQVEEADPTIIGVGGGIEGGYRLRSAAEGGTAEEEFQLAPRGFFEVGRRNLWGKNRSINLFTRVSLRPRDIRGEDQGYGLNEYRVVGTFREPRAFTTMADLRLTGVLEQAERSSFNFSRRQAYAELALPMTRGYAVSGSYSFERTELFDERYPADEQPLIDRLFPQVRLSKLAGSIVRDTRDDPVDAARGRLMVGNVDVAARAIGSEVGFVKTYVQGFSYHRIPAVRRTVFVMGARLGAAHGFAREIEGQVVQDLPASERFFAGGDTSVRGFALDRLGNEETITPSGFPTGGNSVVVLNSEMRVGLFGALQGIVFLDAGNVFPRASSIDLMDLRPAAGVGASYRSPVGPVRVDLGFNLNPRELVAGTSERRWVVHILLGQPF